MFDSMVMVKEEDCERIAFTFFDSQLYDWPASHSRSFPLVKVFPGVGYVQTNLKIVILVQEELFDFARIRSMYFVEFLCEAPPAIHCNY